MLFESDPTEEDITKDDYDRHAEFLRQYGFTIAGRSNKLKFKNKFYPTNTRTRRSQAADRLRPTVEEVEREGLPTRKTNDEPRTIIIPSDRDQLRHDLCIMLAGVQAGNNNSFDHTNAIMKELMKQKLLSGKEYREILRTYFHL